MPTVSPTQWTQQELITAASLNQPTNQLAAVINGGIDDANISSISGSKINAGTIPASAATPEANVETRMAESHADFIASGCLWSAGGGLTGSMTSGVVYIGGVRVTVAAISSYTFTASQDTYISVSNTGSVSYAPVANGASSPSLPANTAWLAKVVTGASTVSSVTTFGRDSNGNPIYPKGGTRAKNLLFGTIARRQGGDAAVWGTAGTTTYDVSNTDPLTQVGTVNISPGTTAVTFPLAFVGTPIVLFSPQSYAGSYPSWYLVSVSNTGFSIQVTGGQSNVASFWMAIGV